MPTRDLTGKQFYRWTVLDDYIVTPKSEKKWHCRCTCGTERYVREESLLKAKSTSCGCLRSDKSIKAVTLDLTGRQYGCLTVLGRGNKNLRNGTVSWLCRCTCGTEAEYPASALISGRRKDCGCIVKSLRQPQDLTGRQYGRLTVLRRQQEDEPYPGKWHCRCVCGNEKYTTAYNLLHGICKSCGCLRKEQYARQNRLIELAGRTSAANLKKKTVAANNSTGCRGVSMLNGKYYAKIMFQKKQYNLGLYSTFEEAAAARKQAEQNVYEKYLAYYERWLRCAEADSTWAAENPIRLKVTRTASGLSLEILPELNDPED